MPTPTVETILGYLEEVAIELELHHRPVSYIFKLGCGCSVYERESVLGHLWDKCEHQESDFWCDRYAEHGRTVKHHIRTDEIETIWAGLTVEREDLDALTKRREEIKEKLVSKDTHEYVTILEQYDAINNKAPMSVLEEKGMRDAVAEWYLRHDLTPPEFEALHKVALAATALNSIIRILVNEPDTARLTLFGFCDCVEP
jgi:hypothetical protein